MKDKKMIPQKQIGKIAAIGGLSLNALILLTFVAAVVYSYSVGPSSRMNSFPTIKMPASKPVAVPEVPPKPPVMIAKPEKHITQAIPQSERACQICIMNKCSDETIECIKNTSCNAMIMCVGNCNYDPSKCIDKCSIGIPHEAFIKYKTMFLCQVSLCHNECAD